MIKNIVIATIAALIFIAISGLGLYCYWQYEQDNTMDFSYMKNRDADNAKSENLETNIIYFDEPSEAYSAPLLKPGAKGKAEILADLSPKGFGPGSDAKAVAHWNTVPFQEFSGDFSVGILAFHINEIEKVVFTANNGEPVEIKKMSINPRTRVSEYWVTLRSSEFKSGVVTVQAIVYPVTGVPRELTPLHLYSWGTDKRTTPVRYVSTSGNDKTGKGTQDVPFASIGRAALDIQSKAGDKTSDGGIIYLSRGTHSYGEGKRTRRILTKNKWLTITREPGQLKSDVILISRSSENRLDTKLIKISDITVQASSQPTVLLTSSTMDDYLWIENCNLLGSGATDRCRWATGWKNIYVTDTNISDCANGFRANLQRDVTITNIGSDAFTDSGAIINCSVEGIDPTGSKFHPDVVQYYSNRENLLVFGLTADTNIYAQGLFAGSMIDLENVAFIKCKLNNRTRKNPMRVFQFGGKVKHMLIKDSEFTGPANWRTDLGFSAYNIVIENTLFIPGPRPTPDNTTGVSYR